jgi:thiol-disulfide isomerase/thioredoxin
MRRIEMGANTTTGSLCFVLAAAAIWGCLLCISGDGAGAQQNTAPGRETGGVAEMNCLPGDPAPALVMREWIQRGVYDEITPTDDGGIITVIEFWASWCPLCRTVLPLHDDLQAELKGRGVRLLAVSPEEPEDVRAYVEHANLEHLGIACDDGERTLDSFRSPEQDMPIPFAVIVEEGGSTGAARLLWKGPVITYDGSGAWAWAYTRSLDDVLASVLAEGFDAAAAREMEVCRPELVHLKRQIERIHWGGEPGQVGPLAEQIAGRQWPAELNELAVSALATAAYCLATADEHTEEEAAFSLELARKSLEMAGEEHHALLHILARALFANGQVAEAVGAERKAIETYEEGDGFTKSEYLDALARYERAMAGEEEGTSEDASEEEAPEQALSEETQELLPPPERVSAEAAKEDLLHLHAQLHLHYAGYDDVAWQLSCADSSWCEHNEAFLRRIEEQKEWPLPDFVELLMDYLRIADDRHLILQAVHSQTDQQDYRPVRGYVPFFADVRVAEQEGRMVLVAVPPELSRLNGAEVAGMPVIPSPRRARPGRVYLFPTLPREADETDAEEYLLGLLADEDQDAPESVTIFAVRRYGASSGRIEQVSLALHRGRVVFRGERDPGWSLDLEPVPVLSVRRMWGDGLDDMPETADRLRESHTVVLDLRGNGGGSDQWARRWCSRFTDQPLRKYQGYANLRQGATDPLRRWDSAILGTESGNVGGTASSAKPPFCGRLFAIIDGGVASSGETFTTLASQIHGAVLLGENTAGFITYGNVATIVLPNSRLQLACGPTKFILAGRPGRERFGVFPDYWLDTEDPVQAILETVTRTQ